MYGIKNISQVELYKKNIRFFNKSCIKKATFVETKGGRNYIMPYSQKAKYKHNRQKPPSQFVKTSMKTVPLSHTSYSGEKFDVPGAKAVVGKLKAQFRKRGKSGNKVSWAVQSILTPKS